LEPTQELDYGKDVFLDLKPKLEPGKNKIENRLRMYMLKKGFVSKINK
jgi:hypothetical protein